MHEAPGLVTLHLWGVYPRDIPWALSRMARQRGPLRRAPGLRFGRLLGTGRGTTFTPTDADPLHWALLGCWDSAARAAAFEADPLITGWNARCAERWRLELRPLRSSGCWSGREPFGPATASSPVTCDPCAILTRARLAPRKAVAFWRAVPAVAAALAAAPGLRFARGIGEAPVGLQATFSVWDSLDAATSFAYRCAAHRRVIERTTQTGWYSEQLFARFAVIGASGTVDGRDPLGLRSGAG